MGSKKGVGGGAGEGERERARERESERRKQWCVLMLSKHCNATSQFLQAWGRSRSGEGGTGDARFWLGVRFRESVCECVWGGGVI